jgi:hypothetical protein
VLRGAAVSLSAVTVRGDNVCRIRQDSGQLVARLWEEARTALTATQLSTASRTLEARVVRFDRATDKSGKKVLSGHSSSTEGATDRPFASTSPDSLARFGYVRELPDSSVVYDAPDADALLSDQFAALHCFRVVPPAAQHPEWVGVAFKPARTREGIEDIEGTLWLDRTSAELRRLDFAYTNVTDEFREAGTGGFVEFVRLPSGHWFVSQWTIRMPRSHYVVETTFRGPQAQARGASRRLVIDGLQLAGGQVERVTREGVELYKAGVITPVVVAPEVPSIVGTLYDSLAGAPLRSAVVHLQGFSRETRSDSAGRFRLDSVPAGKQLLWIEHPALDAVGLYSLSVELDVGAGGETSAELSVASFATLWRQACGSAPLPRDDAGFVFGHLTRLAGVPVDSTAMVQASWSAVPLGGGDSPAGPTALRAPLAGDDTYALCGVPVRERISLHATQSTLATPSMSLRVGEMRIARRDLTLADAAAMSLVARADSGGSAEGATPGAATGTATLAGTVVASDGRPIPAARVVVSDVAGIATADGRGRFARHDLPTGAHVVTVAAIGHAPLRTIVDLYPFDSVTIDARLPRVTSLATVTVSEGRRRAAEVYDINMRIAGAPGRFVDSTAIAKMPGLWAAFEQPSLYVDKNGGGAGAWTVIVRKVPLFKPNVENCSPAIFVDGLQGTAQELADINKDNVAVIETYVRGGSTPLKYMVNACGTILVWTKQYVNLR